MCGIFGILSSTPIARRELEHLGLHAERRGRDSSGLLFASRDNIYKIRRESSPISRTLRGINFSNCSFVMGHSRLITNGLSDNQPIYRDSVCVIHNGIVLNHACLWKQLRSSRKQQIDTEVIAAIAAEFLSERGNPRDLADRILGLCKGVISCALAVPRLGKLCLFSNNGSLYVGSKKTATYFASERFPLEELGCIHIRQIRNQAEVLDIPVSNEEPSICETDHRTKDLIPSLGQNHFEERMLEYTRYDVRRCTRCILPNTMPFIRFDEKGVCNYCRNYKPRNKPRPINELSNLVEPYRRTIGDECIVPFSGGRDSCYGLHLVVKELHMKPIAYTYDWGMVTDLGRRNISRMCYQLGVENIIVADDIALKRRNIALNFAAWLKAPHLGMVSILTSGDKHFFRHIETVKQQSGVGLNLWGINPLEVTHFKAGFLGVPPAFEEDRVYSSGIARQLSYQVRRFGAMLKSPGYFNRSLWDTLSGEYYRSFSKKTDYHHIFDYWRWDERIVNDTLINQYDWERAPDTNTTWRIGDGTAAIYNYIYYTVAGFTEHDTFRSNQIREGDLSRDEALALVEDENRPRYSNIKWYLDAIGMDFPAVIKVINSIPKLCD